MKATELIRGLREENGTLIIKNIDDKNQIDDYEKRIQMLEIQGWLRSFHR